ncbi:hypothetical protein [Halobellus ordinarius]|uniref:hypothetical protein n=1 Tax=Halobellus ordinarius TaxID=3075120 RepID=UPI00288058E4|nr:hypothetical protein [Halobellus sp. ZY16]
MTDVDGALLDELEAILADRGRSDAITSAELAERLDIDDGEASPETRAAVRALLFERNVPVRSGNVGYWVCQSEAEAEEYESDLEGRIEGIEQRLTAFRTAWQEWNRAKIPKAAREKIKADPVLEIDDFEPADFRPDVRADGGDPR